MVITVPPQKHSFRAALSLADAIPVPEMHSNAQYNEEAAAGIQGRCNVGMRRPRSGCRAEARRRRDVAPKQLQNTRIPRSSSCDKLAGDTASTVSLRSHFSELDGVPCERIFFVRKVQRLGLESADAVRAHFSAYGDVEDVLVAHSPVLSGCKTYVRRLRPSNLAIVIMATAQMAERVHRQGRDQVVNGSSVRVEPYERRGQAQGKELEVATCDTLANCDATSCGEASFDAESTFDGCSSSHSDVFSDTNDDDACISGDFEYWATDDEGEW